MVKVFLLNKKFKKSNNNLMVSCGYVHKNSDYSLIKVHLVTGKKECINDLYMKLLKFFHNEGFHLVQENRKNKREIIS